MDNPTPNEVTTALQVLRRYNEYLREEAAQETREAAPTKAGVREGDALEARVMAEVQNVDDIIARLVVWADQLKQRQTVRRSYGQSV